VLVLEAYCCNALQIYASVVSTLLALMDGLADRGNVVVIAATNRCEVSTEACTVYEYSAQLDLCLMTLGSGIRSRFSKRCQSEELCDD
jgi:hypothetical protein